MSFQLKNLPTEEQIHAFEAILTKAKELGFDGFGGNCGEAAVAINRILFQGKEEIQGCFNDAFYKKAKHLGHIAVCSDIGGYKKLYLDADGEPKNYSDIEEWGMLDTKEPQAQQRAKQLGFKLTTKKAEGVGCFIFDNEEEVLKTMPGDGLNHKLKLLEQAVACFLQSRGDKVKASSATSHSPCPSQPK